MPLFLHSKDGEYAIKFANGAIHAGCHHATYGGGKQRWKELRELYETTEEKLKSREERLNAERREWAKAAAESAGIPHKSANKPPVGLYYKALISASRSESRFRRVVDGLTV